MLLKLLKREYFEKQTEKNGGDTRRNWQLKNDLEQHVGAMLVKMTVRERSLTESVDIVIPFSDAFATSAGCHDDAPFSMQPRSPCGRHL